MNRGGVGVLLLATLAVSIFMSPFAVPQAARTSRQAQALPVPSAAGGPQTLFNACDPRPESDRSRSCATKDLFDAIAAYFNPSVLTPPVTATPGVPQTDTCSDATKAKNREADLLAHWNVPCEARKNLKMLIATVPDPVHTRLSLMFDRQMDAIEEGAQAAGYLYAGSTIAWDNKAHAEPTDFRIRLEEQAYQSEKEEWPGLMIFRGVPADGLDSSLFVLVVGEKPTDGINKTQFTNAMRIIRDIEIGGTSSNIRQPLRILGPTFSGSLYSLAFLLKQQMPDSSRHSIYSGTASSAKTITWFKAYKLAEPAPPAASTAINFNSLQGTDDDEVGGMQPFFEAYDDKCRVAVLSEAETAYGSISVEKPPQPESPQSPSEASSSSQASGRRTDVTGSTSLPNGCRKENFLQIHFPRDISQLRSAYQQSLAGVNSTADQNAAPRTVLPLNLQDNGGEDTVPAFSANQDPLSQEAVLMGIVSRLQERGIKLVLLESTNPLDLLFLARYLRIAYSTAHVVIVTSDLLLPREVDDPRLQGVMELSSYPLLPIDLEPGIVGRPAGPKIEQFGIVFPSYASEGTFFATLSLLCEGNSTEACKVRKSAASPFPSWLTVLGGGRLWPVAFKDATNTPSVAGPAMLSLLPVPFSWNVFSLVCIGLIAGYLFIVWGGSTLSRAKVLANFAPVSDPWRNSVLLAGDVIVIITLLCLLGPWLQRRSLEGSSEWELLCLGTLIVAFLTILLGDLKVRGSSNWAAVLLITAILLLVGASILFYRHGADDAFALYRYMNVTSGVSPLVPVALLLIAGMWWCWYTLAGLMVWENYGVSLPESERTGRNLGPAARARILPLTDGRNQALLEAMRPGSDYRVWLSAIGMLAAIFSIGVFHPLRSLEGPFYDWLYSAGLALVLLILVLEAVRIVVIWLELRALLQALDRLPLRRAFKRMKELTQKRLWQLGSSAFQDFFGIVSREREVLRRWLKIEKDEGVSNSFDEFQREANGMAEWIERLGASSPQSDARSEPAWKSSVQRLVNFISRKNMRWSRESIGRIGDLQGPLGSICAATLNYLNEEWESQKSFASGKSSATQAEERWKLTTMEEAVPTKEPNGDRKDALTRTVTLTNETKAATDEFKGPEANKCAEEFICLFYFNVISCVFMRIRTLVMIVGGMYVFVLLSFASYPFEPKESFDALMIGLLLLLTGMIGFVFAQMHRDSILSYITDTKPGELGFDFWLRLASFIALPLFGLLAVKFPAIGGFLFSWLAPATQPLKYPQPRP